MADCKNCMYCDVITDEEWCKRLKCKATKRGKTITWTMCCLTSDFHPSNSFQYFADWVETHKTPKWCPRKKEAENGQEQI